MLAARYGLTQCCAEDLQKWDIKKSLLDLNAIYDPELCKCVIKPKCCPPTNVQAFIIPPSLACVCYQIMVSKNTIKVDYIGCDGIASEVELNGGDILSTCASQTPVITPGPNSRYTIQSLAGNCSSNEDCVACLPPRKVKAIITE